MIATGLRDRRRGHVVGPEEISWGELGCPKADGYYRARGHKVRVKSIHIAAAEDDPAALFTMVALRPPLGPPQYRLGYRIA